MVKHHKSFEQARAKLYIVSTPIGNLEDITYRAIRILSECDSIYCEDTRNTQVLLNHYDIHIPLRSYHLFNENEITNQVLEQVENGHNVAIVSDAGTPLLSDPGYVAVREARLRDIDVVVIPGASALLTALVGSAIPLQSFYFAGFLDHKSTKRREELQKLALKDAPIVLYEAPHRLMSTLELILDVFGDCHVVIARELTKRFEEYISGNVSDLLQDELMIKGEMVIIIEPLAPKESTLGQDLTIQEHFKIYIEMGIDAKTALKKVASERGISKNEVYDVIYKKK